MKQAQAVVQTATGMPRRIVKNTVWVAAGRVSDILAVLLTKMLLSRWLPPADFASFITYFNYVALLSICGTLGFNRSIVRFISENLSSGLPEQARHVLKYAAVATLVGATMFALGTAAVAAWLLEEGKSYLLPIGLAACVATRALLRLFAEALRGYHEIRWASAFAGQNSGQACGPATDFIYLAFAAFAFLFLEPSLSTAVMANAVAILATLPVAWWLLKRQANAVVAGSQPARDQSGDIATPSASPEPFSQRVPAVSESASQRVLAVSLATLLVQVFVYTSWNSDIWLADFWLDDKQAPLYIAARDILVVLMLPLGMINMAVISSIPELYTKRQLPELEKLLRLSATAAALPGMCAIAVLLLFPATVLNTYGQYYREGASVLMILSLGQIINMFSGSCGIALMMTGHERLHLVISFATTMILWILGPIAARNYNMEGLAVVSAVVFSIQFLSLWIAVKVRIGVWSHPVLVIPTPEKLRMLRR